MAICIYYYCCCYITSIITIIIVREKFKTVKTDSVIGLLHHLVVSNVTNVSETCCYHLEGQRVRGSTYLQNVGATVHKHRTELTLIINDSEEPKITNNSY
jgi:hypothetical protein